MEQRIPLKGFARLSPEQRRKIAAKGGAAVKAENRAFSKNKLLAKTSGSKGGKSVPDTSRSYYLNRELAKTSGSKGGKHPKKKPPEETA